MRSQLTNPIAVWRRGVQQLMVQDEDTRRMLAAVAVAIWSDLRDLHTVSELTEVYRFHEDRERCAALARAALPPEAQPLAASALQLAKDAAYFRRYRQVLDASPSDV